MDGTLPVGATLTGAYGPPKAKDVEFVGVLAGPMSANEEYLLPVPFELPLNTAPTFVFVPNSGGSFGSNAGAGCPGVTAGIPQANSGKFCVYANTFDAGGGPIPIATATSFSAAGFPVEGTGNTGALLRVKAPGTCDPVMSICMGSGVWAVGGN